MLSEDIEKVRSSASEDAMGPPLITGEDSTAYVCLLSGEEIAVSFGEETTVMAFKYKIGARRKELDRNRLSLYWEGVELQEYCDDTNGVQLTLHEQGQ